MDVDRGQWAAEHLLHGAQLLCREHDRRTILLYEDEFELTFNLSGEEPQPEQAAQESPAAPRPKAAPAAAAVDEPTRVMVLRVRLRAMAGAF